MTKVNNGVYFYRAQGVDGTHITERKIRGFKRLQKGWHYGEGRPFGDNIINAAISLHKEALRLGFFETDAFPGANGEIMVTIYRHEHYLEFIIERDLTVTFSREDGDDETRYEEGLTLNNAIRVIRDFSGECRQSESSDLTGGTGAGDGFSLWDSRTQARRGNMAMAYQLSEWSVYTIQGTPSVNTSGSIT